MRKSIFISLLVLISTVCSAQDFWTKTKIPDVSAANYLAANSKGWVYIATSEGVYVAKNNGQEITRTNLHEITNRLQINEQDHIYAISYDQRKLYYSEDEGNTWNVNDLAPIFSKNKQPESAEKSKVIGAPIESFYVKGNIVICGGSYNGGVWKSNDSGKTWTKVLSDDDNDYLLLGANFGVVYERNNGTLLLGTSSFIVGKQSEDNNKDYGLGLHKSENEGDNWQYWEGSYDRPGNIQEVVENSKNHLFVATYFYYPDMNGIHMSKDNGASWQHCSHPTIGWDHNLIMTPNDVIYTNFSNGYDSNNQLVRATYRSFNDGNSWSKLQNTLDGEQNPSVYSLCASADGYLYALYRGGYLLRSAYPVTGETCTVMVSVTPNNGGEVEGNDSYHLNETVKLIAKPNTDFEFANWTSAVGTILSEDSVYSFQIKEDTFIKANFRDISGIEELQANTVWVYPNPFTAHIQIKVDDLSISTEKGMIVTIYDMEGRELYKTTTHNGLVNLSHLPKAVYNMQVKIDGKRGVYKIVKQ